jgi:hypothetical protein
MRCPVRFHAAAVLPVIAACSFSPAALPVGATFDAPLVVDGPGAADAAAQLDAPTPDGRGAPDGPSPDAGPPDAEPDPCPSRSSALTLGVPVEGMVQGASQYTPTCVAGASGPESFYHVDTTASITTELVVDVTAEDAGLDNVLDVTGTCMGAPAAGACADVGAAGAGEVVVVPLVSAGRHYIAVDSAVGGQGRFTLLAFLRAVVPKGEACSPELTSSRCQLGESCVEDNGVAQCADLASVTDQGFNDDACAASGNPAYRLNADTAFIGQLDSATDVDVLELDPKTDAKLRVIVTDDRFGCPLDLGLDLVTGKDCNHATQLVKSDENGGLGPCPQLSDVQLVGGQKYWLAVRAGFGAAAKIANGTPYTLVVDFIY